MSKIKIIAEIGINHNGEFEQASKLIEAAAESGVWGIKFQYRNLENSYANNANQIGDEMLLTEIKRNYLSPTSILALVELSHQLGLAAGISFFDASDVDDFIDEIHMFDFFKSPSVELCNIELINKLLSYDKPVYVSLGCHTEDEIDYALSKFSSDNWVAMHCVSNYPVSRENAKLGYLKYMKDKWRRPFGYSSHDSDWEVTLIAMSMGVSVLERHITFDKLADGLDHTTSSTPEEFKKMSLFSESIDLLMAGDAPRAANQGEMLNLQNLGRSYYSNQEVLIGEPIGLDKLVFRSPRVGLGQVEMQQYMNKKAIRNVDQGQVLSRSVFIKPEKVKDKAIDFSRQHKVAIPIRLHDLVSIERNFPVGSYEFHLSYGEVLSDLSANEYRADNRYSIHLPDYINSTQLIDPFSTDKDQVKQSLNILQRTADFADALQQLTGREVPIVGSFSVVHDNIEHFYQQYADLLDHYRQNGISILPQWLPPIAWYFGGSVKLEAFNQAHDIDLIKRHQLPICMDVCHLCMGDSVYDFTSIEVINSLNDMIKHVHIADAKGIDGEGIQFGEGDKKNIKAIESVMNMDCMKVIEVWQGHLDEGAGFAKALNRLEELFR